MLEKKGMPVHNLLFVDHVSKVINSPVEHRNTAYSTGTFTLHKTHTLLSQLVAQTNKERKLVIFDALHDLHHYYDQKTILAAVDHFIDHSRILHLNPVFLFDQSKTTKAVAQKLNRVCDKIIKIE
jgi:hypothetical protein